MTNPKYIAGVLLALPVMPIMWYQGRRILQNMPALSEISDRTGVAGSGQRKLRMVAIGESTIASVGARSGEYGLIGRTASFLADKLGAEVSWHIQAKSGLTIKQVTESFLSDYREEYADIVVVGVGANDVFKLNHPPGFTRDLTNLIELLKLKYGNAPIVFLQMPPINDLPIWSGLLRFFMGGLSDIFDEYMQEITTKFHQVFYCEEPISLRRFKAKVDRPSTTDEFFSDGVHPSELTYQLWGEEVAGFICQKVLTD